MPVLLCDGPCCCKKGAMMGLLIVCKAALTQRHSTLI